MTRRALVIGIDYPGTPYELTGCVNDARQWTAYLVGRGFAVMSLHNADATRAAILGELRALVTVSQPGDVLVCAYSGHGTRVRDLNGDEADGWDEALCPVDMEAGRLVLDDDLFAVLSALTPGVGFTLVADSCHSGTVARFASLTPAGFGPVLPVRRRARFVLPTRAMLEAHALDRASREAPRLVEAPRWATLSACRPDEVAYESEVDGQVGGDFTRAALAVLSRAGGNLTHAGFLRRVSTAMGVNAAQHPTIDGAAGVERRTLVTVPKATP